MSDSSARSLLVDYQRAQSERDFRCGHSVFSDSAWDFYGLVDKPHWRRSQLGLSFRDWEHRPEMQQTIKHYIVSELLQGNTFSSVVRKLQGFARLRMFLEDCPEMISFKQVTAETLRSYYEYLVTTNSVRGQPLMGQSVLKAAQVVKEILVRGSIRGWDVPEGTAYVEPLYDEIILKNKRVRSSKVGHSDVILPSKETVDRILRCAQETNDVITGASIILASQLGLRLSEVLTMEADCLQPIDGEMNIAIFTAKTHKEKIRRLLPANAWVVTAVERLSRHTVALREVSGLPYLFLFQKNGRIQIPTYKSWTKDRLMKFVKRHDIQENGQLVHLTSHVFRHIFSTEALEKGMKIQDVAEMLGHASIAMTESYSHMEDTIRERFAQVFSADNALAGKRAMLLKEQLSKTNPFQGRAIEDVDKLRKAMKIQVLPHGLCLHHPMRNEPCDGDGICRGCPNFITTLEFLPIHKARLAAVTKELAKTTEGPYADKLRNHRDYLQGIITDLESQAKQATEVKS